MNSSKTIFTIGLAAMGLAAMVSPGYSLLTDTRADYSVDWADVDGTGGRINGDNWIPHSTAAGVPIYDAEGGSNDSTNGGTSPLGSGDIASGFNDVTKIPTGTCTYPIATPDTQCGTSPSTFYYFHIVGTNDGTAASLMDDILFIRMRVNGDPTASVGFASGHWNFIIDSDLDDYKEYYVDLNGGGLLATGAGKINIFYENNSANNLTNSDGANSTSCDASGDGTGTLVNSFVACNTEGSTTGDCSYGGADRSFARAVSIPDTVGTSAAYYP
ncbi:MAG: hypothetical protein K9K37_02410 [Desulfocapsa sp.]|nr:hypothetical protein [Desulfocapsa sp.]